MKRPQPPPQRRMKRTDDELFSNPFNALRPDTAYALDPALDRRPVLDTKCMKCRHPVDPCAKGTRMVGKRPPTWKCSRCNCMHSQLSQLFGMWPIAEFSVLSEGEQTKLWNEAGSGKENLKRAVQDILLKRQTDADFAEMAGPLLSLSVWSHQG